MKDKITIKNEKGETKEFDIILSFTKDGKDYVTYTDFSKDENNDINCYSSEIEKNGKLNNIEDENILKLIDSLLLTITETEKDKYKRMKIA